MSMERASPRDETPVPSKSTAYQRRHRHGKGCALYKGVENGPRRICVTLENADFRRMAWLARQRKVPMNTVLRDAVYAYCLPIAADADRDQSTPDIETGDEA